MLYTEKVRELYGAFALFIARHPWKFCIIGFLVNGLLGLGMLKLPEKHLMNNNIEDLYMPRNTATEMTANEILKIFPDHSRENFYYHQTMYKPLFAEIIVWGQNKPNILHESFHGNLRLLIEEVKNLSFSNPNGDESNFYDVCARRNEKCVVNGETIIDSLIENKNGTVPLGSLKLGNVTALENPLLFLANYHLSNETLVNATYLRLRFNLCQDTIKRVEDSSKWLERFVSHMKELKEQCQSKNICLVFSSSKSFLEEIGNDTFKDIPYFSFVFTVYFTYIGFVMSGGNILAKRVHIGRMGIIVTPTSILGAWGILMACEVEFTNVIGITPVLIVCHQIINTMVTLSYLSETNNISDGKERVAYAVRKSAIPVTVTMMCHVVPFVISASTSKYYAVELVSIYVVTTILFNYVNHFVFYTACLSIHELRIDAGRHCCICTKLRPREELEGRNCCIICCCSGTRPNTKADTESSVEKLAQTVMRRVLLTIPVKCIALITFLALVTSTIFGLLNYNIDIIQNNEVLPESYYFNWNEVVSSHFENRPIIQFVTFHPYGYFNDTSDVLELRQNLAEKQHNVVSWSDVLNDNSHSNASSKIDLYETVKPQFDKIDQVFSNDIYFDKTRSIITVSRFYMQSKNIISSKALVLLKKELLEIADEFNEVLKDKYGEFDENFLPISWDENFILVLSPDFYQIDELYRPLWEILIFTGTQLGILLFLFLFLRPSLAFQILIFSAYISMLTSIFGMSYYMGVYLTQISLIMFINVGCFCIEIIVHIFYAFSEAPGDNKADHLNSIVGNNIQKVFHTMFGLFLGILVLFVVRSYVFVTVFTISLLTISLGILFTILWFPSILSIFGPVGSRLQPESISIYITGSVPDKILNKKQSFSNDGFENLSFEPSSKHE